MDPIWLPNSYGICGEKITEDKLIKDLKYLQKQLLVETNPNKRIEIMRKIELIASIYN